MRWQEIGETSCSIARCLSVVGDRWTLLILREAFLGTRRFEDFQRHLGVTRHRLADRLRRLVENDVLDRVPYQYRPQRFEYRLTDKGRDLYPVIVALMRWGDRWMTGQEGPPVELVHRSCGHAMTPELMCPECGEALHLDDVQARMNPALLRLRDQRAAPSREGD
jgi:DNA-binding HxlR family transcriptional regulator